MEKEKEYVNICREEQIRLFADLPKIQDPKLAAFAIMRSAMRVYDCDWCGILSIDLVTNTYCPYWWIEKGIGEMAPTLFYSIELNELYAHWMEALENLQPIIVSDRDIDVNVTDDERENYKRLETYSVIGCPFNNHGSAGFLVVRNAGRFGGETSYLSALSYLISSKMGEQRGIDSLRLKVDENEIKDENEVRVYLFGGIRLRTMGYELAEKELNSIGSWNILVYLLMHRKYGCTSEELSRIDYNPSLVDNRRKSVRQKISRINGKFQLICRKNLIISRPTQNRERLYCINPELKIWADYEIFENLIYQAHRSSNQKTAMNLIKKAIELYKGSAYPNQEFADWFVEIANYYKNLNLENLRILAEYMDRMRNYRELLSYCTMVYHTVPNERDAYFWMAYCLKKMRRYRAAQQVLEEARIKLSVEEGSEIMAELENVIC